MAREGRLQVRMEEELLNQLEDCAKKADVSSNQIVRGLLRWFLEKAHPGMEPFRDEAGFVCQRTQPGCIWAGTKGMRWSEEEREYAVNSGRLTPDEVDDYPGSVVMYLDFTERRVLRDEFESKPPVSEATKNLASTRSTERPAEIEPEAEKQTEKKATRRTGKRKA